MSDLLNGRETFYYEKTFSNATNTKENIMGKEFEKCKFERINLMECVLEN